MNLSPIVLFVYNRPWHTKKTLDALANNTLAESSTLFVYCDGAKNGANKDTLINIEETRKLIRNETRFKEVIVIEQNTNKGLANSIIEGVTQIVNKNGKIIVLEDDIVTSKGFLKYMNDALHVYETTDEVMHVSGYMFPLREKLPETFFLKPTTCWGWATWKSSWQHFEKNAEKQIRQIEEKNAWKEFTIGNSFPSYKDQLILNKIGRLDTWAIFWHASVFLKGGVSLHPRLSLIQNIGFDGTGEHCTEEGNIRSPYSPTEIAEEITVIKKSNFKSSKEFYYLKNFFTELINIEKNLSTRDKFYLFRKDVVSDLKNISGKIFPSSQKENKDVPPVNNPELNRYYPGVTTLFEKSFEYVDFASFKFIKDEIMNHEIYKFYTVNPSPYIIDAGANIGLAIIYFKRMYPDAEIVGFEPDDKVFRTLQKNIATFKFKNVTLINKALWNEETVLNFYAEGADGGRIAKSVDRNNLIEIQTVRLRNYLNRPVDFLKIDIEGAETKVLSDCADLLSNVERIFVEYHSFANEPQHLQDLLSTLSNSGFRYYLQHIGVFSRRPFIHLETYLGMDLQLNIYAFRKLN